MRLPEPKKLPSGNWRIQVLVDGKRVGRTFPTKEEAEYWAAGLKTKIMEENRSPWKMTVGAAVDRYIESKSSILSPSTVLGYKRTKKRLFLMAPLHHHFEKKGWSETKVVIRFWIVSGALAGFGFVLFFIQPIVMGMVA